MPAYIYRNPKNGEIIEVIQSIHEEHQYVDSDGIKWDRVFTAPEINTQEKLDIKSSEKDFARITKNKKGSVGDLWDQSAELSEKRKKVYGEDPVKKKYFEDWSKKRKGKIHPKKHLD